LGQLGVATDRAYGPPRLLEAWLRRPGSVPCICSLLVRRAAAVACGGFDESIQDMYEDQVFLAKMVLAGPVLVEPGCGERYRQHAGSTSARAIEDQRYHPTRPNESRRDFLRWLAGYVAGHPAGADARLQRALREARRPYDT
jgi:GT2 family glycosyltransferase